MSETGPDEPDERFRSLINQGLIDSLDRERDPQELARKVAGLEVAAQGHLEITPEVRAALERAKRRL